MDMSCKLGIDAMETTRSGIKGKISDIMTRSPVTAYVQDTVHRVEEILQANALSSLPVVDPDQHDCFGIISLKDLARFHAENRNALAVRAWELCSYKPLAVGPESSLEEAARLMVEHSIHHLVVQDDGILCGYVSSLDIVAACLPS